MKVERERVSGEGESEGDDVKIEGERDGGEGESERDGVKVESDRVSGEAQREPTSPRTRIHRNLPAILTSPCM